MHPLGGRGPLTWALFGENYAKTKELGPGGRALGTPPLDPPMVRVILIENFVSPDQ